MGRREKRLWKKMSEDEVLQLWKSNYRGISPGKLRSLDPGYYKELRKRELLQRAWSFYQKHLELQLLPSISEALEDFSKS